jgi:ParB/RepB/Spo0J family partition protein
MYQTIDVAKVACLHQTRPIVESRVKLLMESIQEVGQINPVLVCPHPKLKDNYGLFEGFHRFEAHIRLNRQTIDAKVFPAGLSVDRMIVLSMTDNNLRTPVNFMDAADRIATLAGELDITMTHAAKLCGWSPSKASQCVQAAENLEPSVRLKLANANIGYGMAYPLSKEMHEIQLSLVDEVVAGMTREQLKQRLKTPREKHITFKVSAAGGFDALIEQLNERVAQVKSLQKQGIPFHLLGQILS